MHNILLIKHNSLIKLYIPTFVTLSHSLSTLNTNDIVSNLRANSSPKIGNNSSKTHPTPKLSKNSHKKLSEN